MDEKLSKFATGCVMVIGCILITLLMFYMSEKGISELIIALVCFLIAAIMVVVSLIVPEHKLMSAEELKKEGIRQFLAEQAEIKKQKNSYKFDFMDMVEGYDFVYQFEKYFNLKIDFYLTLEKFDGIYDAIVNKIPLPVHFEIHISEWKEEEKFDDLFYEFYKAEKATEGKFTYEIERYDKIYDIEHEKEYERSLKTPYERYYDDLYGLDD